MNVHVPEKKDDRSIAVASELPRKERMIGRLVKNVQVYEVEEAEYFLLLRHGNKVQGGRDDEKSIQNNRWVKGRVKMR